MKQQQTDIYLNNKQNTDIMDSTQRQPMQNRLLIVGRYKQNDCIRFRTYNIQFLAENRRGLHFSSHNCPNQFPLSLIGSCFNLDIKYFANITAICIVDLCCVFLQYITKLRIIGIEETVKVKEGFTNLVKGIPLLLVLSQFR